MFTITTTTDTTSLAIDNLSTVLKGLIGLLLSLSVPLFYYRHWARNNKTLHSEQKAYIYKFKHKRGKKKGKKKIPVSIESESEEEDNSDMVSSSSKVAKGNGLSSNWKRLQKMLKGDTDTKVTKTKPTRKVKTKRTKTATSYEQVENQEKTKKSNTTKDSMELVRLRKTGRSAAQILLAEDPKLASTSTTTQESNIDSEKKSLPGKYLAVDCEFVGVGPNGSRSVLARVSIVNYYGHVILDKFVKPTERVTDWRTWVSGITPIMVRDAESFESVQKQVADLFQGKILVGHAIRNDLHSLMISHARSRIRDTSLHKPFRKLTKGGPPALKRLAEELLSLDIQKGEHSSVEDAQATMLLFRLHKHQFDEYNKKVISN